MKIVSMLALLVSFVFTMGSVILYLSGAISPTVSAAFFMVGMFLLFIAITPNRRRRR